MIDEVALYPVANARDWIEQNETDQLAWLSDGGEFVTIEKVDGRWVGVAFKYDGKKLHHVSLDIAPLLMRAEFGAPSIAASELVIELRQLIAASKPPAPPSKDIPPPPPPPPIVKVY